MTKQPDDFTAMLADGEGQNSYSMTNRNLQKNLLLFCAKRVCALSGEIPPLIWTSSAATSASL